MTPQTINCYDEDGKLANWPITNAPDDIVVSLSGSFQLDFVMHDAPDGFRHCCTRLKKWIGYDGQVRVGVDYKSLITITITVPIKLSITITITVVIEKAITITITIIRLRLRLQLLVYHGNDSRLFIRHVHLQYYHAWLSELLCWGVRMWTIKLSSCTQGCQ